MNEEADIIRKAQQDIKYFEPLYNKYFDAIFRFLHRKTDDEDEAADLTSRVFLQAMNGIRKYEIRDVGFGAWLYKIATNESYKYFRKTKRRFLSLEDDKVNEVMTCGELEDMDEKIRLLRQMIEELKDTEVRILELKFFENRNFAEIAFILEEKESAVKMRLYRALDKLKKKYEEFTRSTRR